MTVNQPTDSESTHAIQILVNDKVVTICDAEVTLTLLSFLRTKMQLPGTKEGCAEGDCGACTVVIADLQDGQPVLRTVNACIQLMPALDGKAIYTVEYLRQSNEGRLHPVQQAMVDCHGSQCGFCTPGFVMSLWQVYNDHNKNYHSEDNSECESGESKPGESKSGADDATLRRSLSGNLCRCTGYRPILQAGQKMFDFPTVAFDRDGLKANLLPLQRDKPLTYNYQGATFHAPQQIDALLQLRASLPDATILAGCTDIGLWVNKQFRDPGDVIYVGQVDELKRVQISDHNILIGAGVSLTDAYEAILSRYPQLSEMHQRFASLPVRNAGTLGGNVANGSPIGDSMPWLIALGARVHLQNSQQHRSLLLQDYYIDYMQTALRGNELVTAIEVPAPQPAQLFRTYKLSKRYDSDISAVCGGFSIVIDNGLIGDAVIAFGGMAAIPKRATACEQALLGKSWNETTVRAAQSALSSDFQPLSDMRASSENRQQCAQNLLYRFYLETRPHDPLPVNQLSVFEIA